MKLDKNLANLHIFMIGIGGISMSGLAKILLNWGCRVSGSDVKTSQIIADLERQLINVSIGHSPNNIKQDIDLIVYSGAIHDDNCEIIRAKELGIPIIERAELLGIIANNYKHVIAVSGTHGKTTTTAMISEIFNQAGLSPTIHIGGVSVNLQSNTIIGNNDYLILEACEYRESFRYLFPETLVITNIESEHLDYYGDYESIQLAFHRLANRSSNVIANKDDIVNHTISIEDFKVKNIKLLKNGYTFEVDYLDKFSINIRLNVIGRHNIINSLFAIAVAYLYKVPADIIKMALERFNGCERRYESIGDVNNISIIIDYAHHPTEIKSSICGIKEHYKNPLIIFQPHTYSRTFKLFDEFLCVLKDVKNLILYQTYPAREKEIIGGRAEDLQKALGSQIDCFTDVKKLMKKIKEILSLKENDCVLVLGAGDLAEMIKNHIKLMIKKYK